MSTPFRLKVITPDKEFFDGETAQIIVRTSQGDTGILANHVKYVANLPVGILKIKMPDGKFRPAAISGGMVKVSKEKTTIIVTAAEWSDEIDLERAKRAEENARELLKAQKSSFEFERANLKLKRALNRINVSNMK